MDHETFNSATWVRARGRTLTLLLALATLVAAFAASNSTQASAADRQLSFSFDRGIINLGSTTGVKIIDPDLSPPDAPSPQRGTKATCIFSSVKRPRSMMTSLSSATVQSRIGTS